MKFEVHKKIENINQGATKKQNISKLNIKSQEEYH